MIGDGMSDMGGSAPRRDDLEVNVQQLAQSEAVRQLLSEERDPDRSRRNRLGSDSNRADASSWGDVEVSGAGHRCGDRKDARTGRQWLVVRERAHRDDEQRGYLPGR